MEEPRPRCVLAEGKRTEALLYAIVVIHVRDVVDMSPGSTLCDAAPCISVHSSHAAEASPPRPRPMARGDERGRWCELYHKLPCESEKSMLCHCKSLSFPEIMSKS